MTRPDPHHARMAKVPDLERFTLYAPLDEPPGRPTVAALLVVWVGLMLGLGLGWAICEVFTAINDWRLG